MKWLKRIFLIIMVLVLIIGGTLIGLNKPLPEGQSGARAEALADSIYYAIHHSAWDSTLALEWTFPLGDHNYLWDRSRDMVKVQWDNKIAYLYTTDRTGIAFENGEALPKGNHILDKAWKFFINDSFWLLAPHKLTQPGTQLKYVETDQGPALLVTYLEGGVTPGDSYLWLLTNDYVPHAWQMWVEVLPIGGLEVSWEGWSATETGLYLAPTRSAGAYSFTLQNIRTATSLEHLLGASQEDPFTSLLEAKKKGLL